MFCPNLCPKFRVALVLALLLGVVLPRPVPCLGQGLGQDLTSGGYWPLFHRDQRRTGLSPFPGPSKGELRWHFKTLKPIDSSPVIGRDGTVYFGCLDGKLYADRKSTRLNSSHSQIS